MPTGVRQSASPAIRNQITLLALLLISAVLPCLGAFDGSAAAIAPANLRCEYQSDPLGIDVLRPRLSWWLESERRNLNQKAYQVVVASSREYLAAGQFDLWDSGRVTSDQSVHVEYSGKPLKSGIACHWKVRVWLRDQSAGAEGDWNEQASSWSAPAFWSMGLLEPVDWQGRWIAATDQISAPRGAGLMGYHAIEARAADEIKWVQIDLGAELVLDAVTLHPPAPPGFEHVNGFGFPKRFRIETSDDPEFHQRHLILDCTQEDYPNPGNKPQNFAANGVRARYIRLTATRLWDRSSGPAPFCFTLAELEVFSDGINIALNAPAVAMDSVEASGWSLKKLTDGERVSGVTDEAPQSPGSAAVLLRKEFALEKSVIRADAFICGLGYSEIELNGRKIGSDLLDPGFTDFTRRVFYRTHDVTADLQPGSNAIGVVLGGGWFKLATADLFGFERAPWSASPRLLLRLEIEYADGSVQSLVSDDSWKWSTGAITFNCIRGGETIDAREDKPGWSIAGYDDSQWHNAVLVKAPDGKLVAQQHPPIRATASILPVKLTEPKPGVYVFDLGVNIAGWARLSTCGPPGTRVKLEYNELLNPDGTVNTRHNTSHTYGRFQTGEYILSGKGIETFEPRFTYHGFRYIQVTGLTEKPTLDTLTGRWVTTDPKPAGQFACSNKRINLIQESIIRTLLNNMHGIPTDCPQREKMGWLNDGCVCMETAFFNLDTPLFYRKWFDDMIDAQDPNGHVADFVPTSGWGRTRSDGSPGEMADPWWGGAIVLAPWKLYQYYGDTRVLREGFDAMKAYVDYLASTAEGHVINWGLGDWLDESAGGGGRRVPVAQTSTAAYYYYAKILSQTASLIGQKEDAPKYADLANAISQVFNEKFLDPVTGLYAKDSQTAHALPLALHLTPAGKRPLVLDQLVRSISDARQNHISAGIVGALYLFHALMDNERDDLAWAMITQEDYPGWLHMLNQGGTSIWEAWNGDASRNHPTFGCVGFWFYQGLAGIRPDPAAPGFKKIFIRPALIGDLTWARARYDSMYGPIFSHWKREDDRLTLTIAIPVNTTAAVFVPTYKPNAVTESGMPAGKAEGVKFLRIEPGAVVYQVGSGKYVFEAPLAASDLTRQ